MPESSSIFGSGIMRQLYIQADQETEKTAWNPVPVTPSRACPWWPTSASQALPPKGSMSFNIAIRAGTIHHRGYRSHLKFECNLMKDLPHLENHLRSIAQLKLPDPDYNGSSVF